MENTKIKWTQFWDMHSGGGTKEAPYEMIYIQAPEDQAKIIFYNKFGHNPERVSCTCCGDDYSISESESLEQLTAYHRGCRSAYFLDGKEVKRDYKAKQENLTWKYLEEPDESDKYKTLDEYKKSKDVLVIYDKDIKPEERTGDVPSEGYVWM